MTELKAEIGQMVSLGLLTWEDNGAHSFTVEITDAGRDALIPAPELPVQNWDFAHDMDPKFVATFRQSFRTLRKEVDDSIRSMTEETARLGRLPGGPEIKKHLDIEATFLTGVIQALCGENVFPDTIRRRFYDYASRFSQETLHCNIERYGHPQLLGSQKTLAAKLIEEKNQEFSDHLLIAASARNGAAPSGELEQRTIVIQAARNEEAFAVNDILSKHAQCEFTVKREDGLVYSETNLFGHRLIVTYPEEQGGVFAASLTTTVLERAKPDLMLMAGICAGLRGKTRLGDLVVAKWSFDYTSGKEADEGRKPAPLQKGPEPAFIIWVEQKMRSKLGWRKLPRQENPMKIATPEHFILRAQYEFEKGGKKSEWLWEHGFDLTKNLAYHHELIDNYQTTVENLIQTGELQITDADEIKLSQDCEKEIRRAIAVFGNFPKLVDCITRESETHCAPYGSGPSVRSDTVGRLFKEDEIENDAFGRRSKVFAECLTHHREVLAVDMETFAFYQACEASARDFDFLAVKAVSDHADHQKSDSIHEYAKQLSAGYLMELIEVWLAQHVETMQEAT